MHRAGASAAGARCFRPRSGAPGPGQGYASPSPSAGAAAGRSSRCQWLACVISRMWPMRPIPQSFRCLDAVARRPSPLAERFAQILGELAP